MLLNSHYATLTASTESVFDELDSAESSWPLQLVLINIGTVSPVSFALEYANSNTGTSTYDGADITVASPLLTACPQTGAYYLGLGGTPQGTFPLNVAPYFSGADLKLHLWSVGTGPIAILALR